MSMGSTSLILTYKKVVLGTVNTEKLVVVLIWRFGDREVSRKINTFGHYITHRLTTKFKSGQNLIAVF